MNPLIDVRTLAAQSAEGPITVLDVRWTLAGSGRDEYAAGHLPGAVFVDLDTDLAASPGVAGRHPLPDADAFTRAMRSCGVFQARPVVVYDAGDSTAAARAWWTLRYFGHRSVKVLDGGYGAWLAAGQIVSTESPEVEVGDFTARPGGMPMVDADGAAAIAADGVLLDARAGERYRGEVEPIDPVAGHIPGAVSAPTVANVGPDGRFLAVAELRERFTALGIKPDVRVGAYCGSGVTAAHEVLAVVLAGLETPALYVGSWSNWVADPTRPVATN